MWHSQAAELCADVLAGLIGARERSVCMRTFASCRISRSWSECRVDGLAAWRDLCNFTSVVAGDCPILGLGSFGTLTFLGLKARSMYGTAHATEFIRRLAHYHKVQCGDKELSALTAAWPRAGLRDVGLAGHGPAPLADVDLFNCQRSEARQTARLRRAAGAGVNVNPAGMSAAKPAYSGEVRVPKSIIPGGKKGIRGFMIVFMEIRAVIGFSREILSRRKLASSRYDCRNKATREIGLRSKGSLFRRKR